MLSQFFAGIDEWIQAWRFPYKASTLASLLDFGSFSSIVSVFDYLVRGTARLFCQCIALEIAIINPLPDLELLPS